MSKRGKYSVQNWQNDPMNSLKAFGELITLQSDLSTYEYILEAVLEIVF